MAGSNYIADPMAETIAVALDGLVALYHRPSGMTHVLAPPAPQILAALAAQAADAATLLERIGAKFDLEGSVEAVEARLAELEAAGLVRQVEA